MALLMSEEPESLKLSEKEAKKTSVWKMPYSRQASLYQY